MKAMNQVLKYFNAEKNESILFIIIGVTAIMLSVYFLLKLKQPFYNGLSYALIAIALVQLTVGFTVFLRSPKDIIRVEQIIETEITKIETEEIPRMKNVMKNFVTYRWVEIVLAIIGIILFFFFQPLTLWKGVGLGLAIQAILMLGLDFFAENRGKIYLEYLREFI